MSTFTAVWEGTAVSENKRLIRAHGRLVMSNPYRVFMWAMVTKLRGEAQRQGWKTLHDDAAVLIEVVCPKQMDHHNLEKPALDALQQAEIIGNDRRAKDVRIVRMGDNRAARIKWTVGRCIDKGDY